MTIVLRPALPEDVPALGALIVRSVHALQGADYDDAQREGALGSAFGVDRQLIADGTYLIAERDGALAGCGGWSRRATLYGADAAAVRDPRLLDPATEPARIRAFFIDPDHARRGVAAAILAACERAAQAEGYRALELMATLTGIPFYAAAGFMPLEEEAAALPNGATMPLRRMRKALVA
ncbi:MAG: GNAT family N-acetyltransferase [Sphingomonas fennica]